MQEGWTPMHMENVQQTEVNMIYFTVGQHSDILTIQITLLGEM